jgi:hypothetical protein
MPNTLSVPLSPPYAAAQSIPLGTRTAGEKTAGHGIVRDGTAENSITGNGYRVTENGIVRDRTGGTGTAGAGTAFPFGSPPPRSAHRRQALLHFLAQSLSWAAHRGNT